MDSTIDENNYYKHLYELTKAWLETARIEKRIQWLENNLLKLELDELRRENLDLKNAGYFNQPPDDQPIVYLTGNVIQFQQATNP